jgi:electron transport complex protein RnfG
MSDVQPQGELPIQASVARIYGVVLSVGVVCALAIVTVYEVTQPIIGRNRIAMRQRAILNVLPGATSSVAFRVNESSGNVEPAKVTDQASDVVFAGFDDDGQLVGLAIETHGMGYQDVIRLLYGYSFAAEAVIGIEVLESRETPGLGDRIEKDTDFLQNFAALDVQLNQQGTELAHQVQWVKPGTKSAAWEIDGITGATISSRAVADMLRESTARWIPRVHARQRDFKLVDQEGS